MLVQNNGVDSLYYTYTDNQGSLIALTDASGNVVRKYAYDPWGARRNASDWTQKDNGNNLIVNRGYTGHEHLDAFGIINMNGRVYDPATGMFLSPDPLIQSPGDWVNYNRYSYCMGNPMRYTDPSGYQTIRNLGSNNGAAANQNDQLAQWGQAWANYYAMKAAIEESIKKWTSIENCYIQGPPQGYIPMASDAQGGTDMYGRNMYDNMGIYIPQYAQPGGANPANYGSPGYGYWETTTTIRSGASYVRHKDGTISDFNYWSETTVDSRFVLSDWTNGIVSWAKDHFYVGLEGEITYGLQFAATLKNGLGLNLDPNSAVMAKGSLSNKEKAFNTENKTVKLYDFGAAYYVGVNYNQTIDYSGLSEEKTNTISVGVFGIFGLTLNYDNNWNFINGYTGIDVSGKIAVGWGASGSAKLGFDF